jgi:hypothetical protein
VEKSANSLTHFCSAFGQVSLYMAVYELLCKFPLSEHIHGNLSACEGYRYCIMVEAVVQLYFRHICDGFWIIITLGGWVDSIE